VQNPRTDKYNKLGTGYPPQCRTELAKLDYKKTKDVFFSGQITHSRRLQMWDQIVGARWLDSDLKKTDGFTQGYEPKEYYARMSRARIAPAPSGPETPDSFRLFEALECMCIPIADEIDPKGHFDGFWEWLFDEVVPFPRISNYKDLANYCGTALDDWQNKVNVQTAWWISKKRQFAYRVVNQLWT
jgi:hypothetical protein